MSDNRNYHDLVEAFVDGELSEDQQTEFENAVATHPDLAASVEFYRRLKKSAGEAISEIDGEPMSPGLEQTIERLRQARPGWREAVGTWWQTFPSPVQGAALASILTVLALVVSLWVRSESAGDAPLLLAGIDVSEAIETLTDDQADGEIRIARSYVGDGSFCRLVLVGGESGAAGLVCWSDAAGAWTITSEEAPLRAEGYVTAGSAASPRLIDALDGLRPSSPEETEAFLVRFDDRSTD
ncbi:MAG: hypothetical protein AAGH41_08965 [Pseudomonadota bacterium]